MTMEWWTHLWLNEGFASYMEYVCVDDLFPQWNMFTEFYSDSFCTAFYDDSFTSTHPIVSFIGKEAFRKGMQIYLNRHKYSNTCTEDLWRALSEGSGFDCEAIMKKFLWNF